MDRPLTVAEIIYRWGSDATHLVMGRLPPDRKWLGEREDVTIGEFSKDQKRLRKEGEESFGSIRRGVLNAVKRIEKCE